MIVFQVTCFSRNRSEVNATQMTIKETLENNQPMSSKLPRKQPSNIRMVELSRNSCDIARSEPGGFRLARLVGIVIKDRIGICVGIDIVPDAVEQLSQVSILRTGLDGADNQLYCRFITIPDKGDEIFGEVAIVLQLILHSPRRGLATSVIGFVEEALAVMGPAFIA